MQAVNSCLAKELAWPSSQFRFCPPQCSAGPWLTQTTACATRRAGSIKLLTLGRKHKIFHICSTVVV